MIQQPTSEPCFGSFRLSCFRLVGVKNGSFNDVFRSVGLGSVVVSESGTVFVCNVQCGIRYRTIHGNGISDTEFKELRLKRRHTVCSHKSRVIKRQLAQMV